MGTLTGLYHVSQVFYMTSSQLTYSHMLDENLFLYSHYKMYNLFSLNLSFKFISEPTTTKVTSVGWQVNQNIHLIFYCNI